MVVAHEVQLPQLVKKYQMKENNKGFFYCLQPCVVWRSAQFVFELFGGLLLLPIALIVMPILLFLAWLKRNEPIKPKSHHIRWAKELHEAKQKFYGNK